MDRVDILIIGGGVVGCAIAAELANPASLTNSRKNSQQRDIFLVERLPRVGMATSTRNSGVVHSGIYYTANSLKARHCVAGNRLTFAFCEKHGVAYKRTGKLVVAQNDGEIKALEALLDRGKANGVEGLRLIAPAEIHAREPHVHGVAALEVPSTGIVSAEELVRAFARVANDAGVNIVTRARVVSLEPAKEGIRVGLFVGDEAGDGSPQEATEFIEARCVINAAGLYADEVAALAGNRSWKIYPVRGEYCEVRGSHAELIRGLVYPLPHADGLSLGMHFTKTIWGTLLIGPTARYVHSKENYERGRLSVADFLPGARQMLPELKEADLQVAYSGLRPKLVPPDQHGMADFVIERDVNVPRMIQLVGIESPGLTAAPSIALQVSEMVEEILA
jgi:glycerol-3-phosphate dehydrogenase